ncbi:MAG: hypothetical protein H8D34_28845 [Chloroflexi bacterium]|nr:hypothetical protein [Chloroflexota bacterium]
MTNRPDRMEIRAEPELKPRLRYIVAHSEYDDKSQADVVHRLLYAEFDRILRRQGHLTSNKPERFQASDRSRDV